MDIKHFLKERGKKVFTVGVVYGAGLLLFVATVAVALTLQSTSIESDSTLTVGGTTATTISIGRIGQTVAFLGNVSSSMIDASGALQIGTTTATTITIGRTGQSVYFPGNVSSTILHASTSMQIATGTAIISHLSATASLTFDAITSSTPCSEKTITVTGADPGNVVAVGAPNNVASNTIWSAFTTSTNTVAVRLCFAGTTNTTINPVAGTWRASVWKY